MEFQVFGSATKKSLGILARVDPLCVHPSREYEEDKMVEFYMCEETSGNGAPW
jgi:hypothetical protein